MVVTLYEAPLLSAQRRNIITDFPGYLNTCKKSVVYTRSYLTLYDSLRLEMAVEDIFDQDVQYPSYVKIVSENAIAYYYVESVEDATPHARVLSLTRDYVNPLLTLDTKVYGQLVAGHYPLTVDSVGCTLPLQQGESKHIKRCRGINGSYFYGWNERARVNLVFRVVIEDEHDKIMDSKVLLIRTLTPQYIDSALLATAYNIVSSMTQIRYRPVGDDSVSHESIYDINEITNVWIVPEGFAPALYDGYEADFATWSTEFSNFSFGIGVPSASMSGLSLDIPTYSNVRTVLGNVLNYVELPFSTEPYRATFTCDYGSDSILNFTMRVNGKCIDMSHTMELGSNLFSNSAATLSGKISRGLSALSGAISIAAGVAAQQPIAIAGGSIAVAQSLAGGIGTRTAVGATGTDALQAALQSSITYADVGYAVSDTGPLALMYFELSNSADIVKTLNLFGVNTNVSFFGDFGSFRVNRYQYVKFDNVRILARNLPPQFVAQLTDLLTTGVHVINSGFMYSDNVWIWDGDRHVL